MTDLKESLAFQDQISERGEHYVCCDLPDGPAVTMSFCGKLDLDNVKDDVGQVNCEECIRIEASSQGCTDDFCLIRHLYGSA